LEAKKQAALAAQCQQLDAAVASLSAEAAECRRVAGSGALALLSARPKEAVAALTRRAGAALAAVRSSRLEACVSAPVPVDLSAQALSDSSFGCVGVAEEKQGEAREFKQVYAGPAQSFRVAGLTSPSTPTCSCLCPGCMETTHQKVLHMVFGARVDPCVKHKNITLGGSGVLRHSRVPRQVPLITLHTSPTRGLPRFFQVSVAVTKLSTVSHLREGVAAKCGLDPRALVFCVVAANKIDSLKRDADLVKRNAYRYDNIDDALTAYQVSRLS
jgi:hypothetical protein